MSQINFDASQVQPSQALDPIPAAWYNAMMDESEMKPTKAADGSAYLQCRFTIIDGQYAGRKVFTNLNLKNSNPVAQEIAYKDLAAICHAVGVMQVQDSQQLHGLPLKLKVKVKAASGDYEARNEVGGYKNINDATAVTSAAPAGQAPWQPPAQQPPAQQPPAQQPPAQQVQQQPPAWQPPAQQVQQQPAWTPPASGQPWTPPAEQQQPPVQQASVQQHPTPVQQTPVQQQQQPPAQNQPPANGAPPPWAQQPQQ